MDERELDRLIDEVKRGGGPRRRFIEFQRPSRAGTDRW